MAYARVLLNLSQGSNSEMRNNYRTILTQLVMLATKYEGRCVSEDFQVSQEEKADCEKTHAKRCFGFLFDTETAAKGFQAEVSAMCNVWRTNRLILVFKAECPQELGTWKAL